MAYCRHCGKELLDDDKFCANCGQSVNLEYASKNKRKTVYDGEIHKCPNCGEVLKAFEIICPACNFELRGAESSKAIKELSDKIEKATSQNQKIAIITSFSIPNTKEDIFEFMILAYSNLMHLNEKDISDAWLVKVEQCYQKAAVSFKKDSDFEKIESKYWEIKIAIKEKDNRIQREIKERRIEEEQKVDTGDFKKSIFRIILVIFMIFSAICIAVAFNDGKIFAGIIAIIIFGLFTVAFLIGNNIIKCSIRNFKLVPTIIAFILFIPYFATYALGGLVVPGSSETIVWNRLAMGDKLPDFGKTEAEVVWDNDSNLILYFYGITDTEFEDYIDSCKAFGYNIDMEDDGANFTAYNSEGYYLHLKYLGWAGKQLTIDLEDPKDTDAIVWPNSTIVETVPIPNYLIGEVSIEYDTSYAVYLVGVEQSYFAEYVSLCMENGFNLDYSKSKTYFRGKNSAGISITVEYKGFNILYIWITD